MIKDDTLERHNVSYRNTWIWTECDGMGRPRLYATLSRGKPPGGAAHGMVVRPHSPAAATQAAYRARKRQVARDLAARECAAIGQALQTQAWADQRWEMSRLIDDSSRDSNMPRQVQVSRETGLPAGAIAIRYGAEARAR